MPTSSIARLADARGADARRAGDRRRLDQGLHLPARGDGLPGDEPRARARRADEAQESALVGELIATPGLLAEALKLEPLVEKIAQKLARARDVLYLGRGAAYPLALEGALKLKELSYIHAEGYAAGELKHGPIALIDEAMPVIVLAPRDARVREDGLQHAGGRRARRPDHPDRRAPMPRRRRRSTLESFLAMPDMGADLRADRLCRAGADARLSYRGHHGQGRRPAAQSGQIRNGGVASDVAAPCAGAQPASKGRFALRRDRV